MSDKYDFGTLSPYEFEALIADLMGAELKVRFETFSEGADAGIDARYSSAEGDIILQAKHYKNSTWSDLKKAAKDESKNIKILDPCKYYFITSQKLTPQKKSDISRLLSHSAAKTQSILGRAEINALINKHPSVEVRHTKLWLSSAGVLSRLLNNDIAVFTEATLEGVERILKVFVPNPSLPTAQRQLDDKHCLIISGPPGVGKTTLAQVLAAQFSEKGWELVAVTDISEAYRSFHRDRKQIFIFDDFLGKTNLDERTLSASDTKIADFIKLIARQKSSKFILTTRKYVFEAARKVSEPLDDDAINLSELVLDLNVYTRAVKAQILYNHLYHSNIPAPLILALIESGAVPRIVDHRNYMPRIIAWMTDELRANSYNASDYSEHFLKVLENPNKIWEKPFREHISQEARILLYCVYFSERERFPRPGVDQEKLKKFFQNCLRNFYVDIDNSLKNLKFEDAIREIESSFIVCENQRVSFINPSVQDFLQQQVSDDTILQNLALSICNFRTAHFFWNQCSHKYKNNNVLIKVIASSILKAIQNNNMNSKLPLSEMSVFIGELIIKTKNYDFIEFLRTVGLSNSFWSIETDNIELISDLLEGEYCKLPYARPYGRLLRRRLHQDLSERVEFLEIEELQILIEGLYISGDSITDEIHGLIRYACEEVIDSMDVDALQQDGGQLDTAVIWLGFIDQVKEYFGDDIYVSNRSEIERYIQKLEYQEDLDMERHWSEAGGNRSDFTPNRKIYGGSSQGFSNHDLRNMFLTLKK